MDMSVRMSVGIIACGHSLWVLGMFCGNCLWDLSVGVAIGISVVLFAGSSVGISV